ncbi:hypothetical protein [Catellatospora sp. NPDC049133]|uniref:hypothetical protein n=1 Tax=Catellatospora sp. NPDC049133 TaxID=3155499 RepID=UPI003407E63E
MRNAIVAALTAFAAVLAVGATPANASINVVCDGYCTIVSTTYVNGGVARSRAEGYFYAVDGDIKGEVSIWDTSADGYRARVWVNIFLECWCVHEEYMVSNRAFDNTNGAGTKIDRSWTFSAGLPAGYLYTVEVKVGRYDANTGAYGVNESQTQRFYIDM